MIGTSVIKELIITIANIWIKLIRIIDNTLEKRGLEVFGSKRKTLKCVWVSGRIIK